LRAIVYTSLKGAATLLRNAPFSAEQVFAAIKAGKSLSFPLPVSAKISVTTQWKDTSSPNVVGALPGSDPTLKAQYVVYSAHLDHLGIGDPVQDDNIYHGALDNASGSAALLESARAFSILRTRPRRSILFLSVTGEESGLLGSDYFAHNPTVPKSSIVADLNSDGVMMIWPLQSIIAFGAEHSSLGKIADVAARRLGLSQSKDPNPQQFFFIRSDQYSFVQQGIPAVWPSPGFNSNDPAIDPQAIFSNWQATRYHKPQDSIEQPGLNFEEAAKYVRFCFLAIYLIAQEPHRPTWNDADFFGDLYATLQ
jgi:Zn-dependent M28 family amino/carboxypeptidase